LRLRISNQRTVAPFDNSEVKESSDAERRILFRWSFPVTNAIFTFMKSNMNEKPAITPNGRQRGNGFCSSYRCSAIDTAPQSVNKELPDGPPMGMEKIMMQYPLDSPSATAGSPQFKFLTHCKERKKELIGLYREFVSKYRKCTHVLMAYFRKAPAALASSMKKFKRSAPIIIWPPGCYVPSRHEPIAE
jgi:hypothetical protein